MAEILLKIAPARPRGWRRILALWCRNRRTRRALLDLPPELLRDLGLSAAAARCEARRPFWRL